MTAIDYINMFNLFWDDEILVTIIKVWQLDVDMGVYGMYGGY